MRLGGIDLTKGDHLKKLSKISTQFFNGPFVVIHSVGDFWCHRPLDECGLRVATKMIKSHYLTLYGVIYSLIPLMLRRGGGRFIAFSCNSVSYNYPEMAPFTSAKAAVESLIKCVANEYSGEGIQANALQLPTIRTSKVLRAKPKGDHDSYITPEELARIVITDLSVSSAYISGSVVKVFRHSDSFYHKAYFERNPTGRSSTTHPRQRRGHRA